MGKLSCITTTKKCCVRLIFVAVTTRVLKTQKNLSQFYGGSANHSCTGVGKKPVPAEDVIPTSVHLKETNSLTQTFAKLYKSSQNQIGKSSRAKTVLDPKLRVVASRMQTIHPQIAPTDCAFKVLSGQILSLQVQECSCKCMSLQKACTCMMCKCLLQV